MMIWKYHNPVIIEAGEGVAAKVGHFLTGGSVLLITTEGMVRRGTSERITKAAPNVGWIVRTIGPNPDLDELESMAAELRPLAVDAIVALGGGSAMDSGKALAAALASDASSPLSLWLRTDAVRKMERVLPLICIPTTAGTGAEVTPFATIWDRVNTKKRSLAGPLLFPRLALLDPTLTLSLPWSETLWGAMDALSHGLETLWNRNATACSLAFGREAVKVVLSTLPMVEALPYSLEYRATLQNTAALAGLAISQSRTAIAHSLSYPLTLHFGVPHGLACSYTIPGIVDLVSARSSWVQEEDERLGVAAASLVRRYDLAGLVAGYCSREDILELGEAMHTPDRADNFVTELAPGDLEAIVSASL